MKSPAFFGVAACAAAVLFTTVALFAEEPATAPASDSTSPSPAAAESPAPAEAADSNPAKPAEPGGDAVSPFDTWLAQPGSNPVPPHADVEKYLGDLQKRQEDLGKILDFLVGKKRLKKEQATKELATIATPADLTMEKWDEIDQKHQAGNLPDADYASSVAAFASKLRALNLAEETLSHQCAQLMLHAADDEPQPVRRPRPKKAATPTPAPAATPAPAKR